MDRETFANSIKQKYPDYANMDSNKLVDLMLKKHPQYKSQIIEKVEPKKTIGNSTVNKTLDYVENVGQQFQQRAEKLTTDLENTGQDYLEKAKKGDVVGATGALLRGGARTAGAVTEQAFTPVAELPIIKDALDWIGGKIGNSEQGKKLAEIMERNPERTQDIMDAVNIATLGTAKQLTAPIGKLAVKTANTGVDVIGAGGNAVLGTIESIASGADKVADFSKGKSDFIKKSIGKLTPKNYDEAVSSIEDAYKTSFVDNKVSINKRLSLLAEKNGSTTDELIYNLSKEGIMPMLEGKLAKFDEEFAGLISRQDKIASTISEALGEYKQLLYIDDLSGVTDNYLRTSSNISPSDLDRALIEKDRIIDSFKTKYGDTITMQELNDLRINMNKNTKAYDSPIFEQDVSDAIGDVTREVIDKVVDSPVVREANQEWGRLQTLKNTMKVFDNQPMDVSAFANQLGRFGGAVILGGLANPLVGAGGGLIVAGAFAGFGGDMISNLLRSNKFNKKAKDLITEQLRQQPDIVEKLISEAKKENARFLRQKLLSEPAPRMGGKNSLGERIDMEGNKILESTEARMLDAEKFYPVTTNPTTKKFQKAFKSTSVPEEFSKNVETIITEALKGDGGTLNLNGAIKEMKDDYIVSIRSKNVAKEGLTKEAVERFLEINQDVVQAFGDDIKVGTFALENGKFSIDINLAIKDIKIANKLAKKGKQQSVFDEATALATNFAKETYIQTGFDGLKPKSLSIEDIKKVLSKETSKKAKASRSN